MLQAFVYSQVWTSLQMQPGGDLKTPEPSVTQNRI